MMKRIHILALTSSILVASSFAYVACSSSSDSGGTNPPPPADTGTGGGDTGSTPGDDTGSNPGDTNVTPGDDTGSNPGDTGSNPGDTGSSGGDAGCGNSPTLHPPTNDAGVVQGPFCPGAGAGGKSTSCAAGQICCEAFSGDAGTGTTSACTAAGTACNSLKWECDAPQMCSTGQSCCGIGTIKPRTNCPYEEIFPTKTSTEAGSHCAASCGASEFTICESQADCTGGKTCTPIKVAGKQIGYCK